MDVATNVIGFLKQLCVCIPQSLRKTLAADNSPLLRHHNKLFCTPDWTNLPLGTAVSVCWLVHQFGVS